MFQSQLSSAAQTSSKLWTLPETMKFMLLLFVWELMAPLVLDDDPRPTHQFHTMQQLTAKRVCHYHAKWCIAIKLSPWLGSLWQKRLSDRHARDLAKLLIISGDVEQNPGPVTCLEPSCGKVFTARKNMLAHHRKIHQNPESHQCSQCPFKTTYKNNLKRHMDCHNREPPAKVIRDQVPEDVDYIIKKLVDKTVQSQKLPGKTALKGRLRIIEIAGEGVDPMMNLVNAEPRIRNEIEDELEQKTGIKLQVVMTVTFSKQNDPGNIETKFFRSNQLSIYRGTEYKIEDTFPRVLRNINQWQKEGSGWVIDSVDKLEVYLTKLQPLRGSSFVELPAYLKNKTALINVHNSDQKCFLWSVLALLHPTSTHNPNRVSNYTPFEGNLNMERIEFPVQKKDFSKFERQNNYGVNVYEFEDEIYPLRISKHTDRRILHLLLYKDHYVAITDLNRLLHDQTRNDRRKFFCPRCLTPRGSEDLLRQHMELCKDEEPTRITMPKDKTLKFKNTSRMLRQPLVLYGDFECLTIPVEEENQTGKTTKNQHHQPCGYGLIEAHSCCGESEFSDPQIYCGEDTVEHFLGRVVEIAEQQQERLNDPVPISPSHCPPAPNSVCHICKDNIAEEAVRDHCHICGEYRGPAHRICNQNFRLSRDVVVVFHNPRKYDGHLIMQSLGKIAEQFGYKIDVVARAMEDYISFSLVKPGSKAEGPGYKIKFIDSVQFLNNSLDGLARNMDPSKLKATRQNFPTDEAFNLVKRKGVYPYDFMNSWEKMDSPLPEQPQFYNHLNDEDVSNEDYQHSKEVYTYFKMTCMRDYHDLYLKTDVLLLADIFEEFRHFTLDKYGLDACHYMTTPGLAWDACLKMTGVELDLLEDEDQYLFCEQGIRGGVSQISFRLAEANNKYIPNYDPSKPTYFIIYWDANNLYGWAMVQKLPVSDFGWMTEEELAWLKENWDSIDADGDTGYIVEVDMDYPDGLHKSHDQYPLAPELMEIDSCSPYCQGLRDKMGINLPPQKKLVPNLRGKKKYILHIRNLQYYLRKGLDLKAVRRGLKFTQKAWLEPYIMFNTRMRMNAQNAFEKDLFKLLNNAVFGKTMENVKNYKDIELVTNEVRFEKLVRNPRFKNCCRFNESLVGVCRLKSSTSLCKPIYCGLTVLDLSKLLMYEWHYDYIIPKYNEGEEQRATLLFTDTDSLCYYIQTEDIYEDMKADADRFDFSDYPKTSSLYSVTNKKVIGKMSDELHGVPVQAFCGLRPKMYALLPEKKRAKGIKKRVVEKKITFADYKNVLLGETSTSHEMTNIRSHRHEIYTETMNKRSLSAYDDKRWLLNHTESRAIGNCENKYD